MASFFFFFFFFLTCPRSRVVFPSHRTPEARKKPGTTFPEASCRDGIDFGTARWIMPGFLAGSMS